MDNLQHIAPQNYHKYDLNHMTQFSLEMTLKTLDPLGLILTEARQPNLHFPEVES